MNASQRESPFAEDCTPDTDVWHTANNAQIYRETAAGFVPIMVEAGYDPKEAVSEACDLADAFFAELDRRFAKP